MPVRTTVPPIAVPVAVKTPVRTPTPAVKRRPVLVATVPPAPRGPSVAIVEKRRVPEKQAVRAPAEAPSPHSQRMPRVAPRAPDGVRAAKVAPVRPEARGRWRGYTRMPLKRRSPVTVWRKSLRYPLNLCRSPPNALLLCRRRGNLHRQRPLKTTRASPSWRFPHAAFKPSRCRKLLPQISAGGRPRKGSAGYP